MAFVEKNDRVTPDVKKSEYNKIKQKLMKKPEEMEETYIKALFIGRASTGKSAVAMDLLKFMNLEDREKLFVIDIEDGDQPNTITYHQDEYMNQNLIRYNPLEKDRKPLPEGGYLETTNYTKTVENILIAGQVIKDHLDAWKVKGIVIDGLATLLKLAEWKNPAENYLGADNKINGKYWTDRAQSFFEIMQFYKGIECDTIFVGNIDFETSALDKGQSKVYTEATDTVYQKVVFSTEELQDSYKRYYGKIEKSKQNIKSSGRRIKFSEVDLEHSEADYWFDATELLNALRPDPNARNSADR